MATVGLILALLCAIGALIYGVKSVNWVLSKDPGNARMQEIAAAVQEGARAYLNRQYTTIAIVGVGVGIIILFTLGGLSAIGFVIGAVCSGAVSYTHLLGLAESFASAYLQTEYKDVVAFTLLILVLLVRPTGLLGRPDVEKV